MEEVQPQLGLLLMVSMLEVQGERGSQQPPQVSTADARLLSIVRGSVLGERLLLKSTVISRGLGLFSYRMF